MTSWRSKFRRNRTSETQDNKPHLLGLFSKNSDDTDTHKTFKSRFLRRSKHEDDARARPQSMFIESTPGLKDVTARNDAPSIQAILDKNRNLRRSNSKSPKSWKRLISGERSPATSRRSEHFRNSENESHGYKEESSSYDNNSAQSRSVDEDRTKKKDAELSTFSRGGGSSNVPERVKNNGDFDEHTPGRRISHIRRQKSMQTEDQTLDRENELTNRKAVRSKTGSPYDNVSQCSDVPRRERRPRSLYFEEGSSRSESEKTDTPRRERRQRTRRGESGDSADSQKTKDGTEITKKDSFVLRKPRAKYPVDDGDDVVKPQKTDHDNQDTKTKKDKSEIVSKRTSVASLRSNASSDQVDRSFRKDGYDSRATDNILGATMNYLESRTKSDLNSLLSTKTQSPAEDEADSFLQRRRRYQGLLADRRGSTSTTLKYENPLYKSVDNSEYQRRNSYFLANKKSVDTEPTRRESYARARPKSLYNYGDSFDFSDNVSKFQSLAKDSSPDKPRESYSVWDRYKKTDNDYSSKQSYSSRASSVASEDIKPRQRPMSLFLADENKGKTPTYRGNWSAAVPKMPAHLRDFSAPQDKNASRISYRRRESQQQQQKEKEKKVEPQQEVDTDEANESEQRQHEKQQHEKGEENVQNAPSFEITLESPKEECETTHLETTITTQNQPKSHLAPPEIAVEDTDSKPTKSQEEHSEDVVVRRRRREHAHAPPARPSSFYLKKTESADANLKETKVKHDSDDDDDDADERSKTRRNLLDSEDIKTGLRRRSAVERRIKSKRVTERPKSVLLADVSRVNIHDPLHDSVDEVKRQFERLLRRTEDWKRRTESLDSKATILTSSYRNLRRTITEIQGESDDVYAVFDDIGTRLVENDTIGFPDTEEEWRRAQEGNRLVEKALKMLLEQQKNPKPEFYYSESESEPESPAEHFYDMPKGSPWSSPESHASRNRSASDYYPLRSSNGSSAENISYAKTTRGNYFSNEYSFATTTRLSPLLSDNYSRRKRLQESSFDYRRDTGIRNSYGRYVPETAV